MAKRAQIEVQTGDADRIFDQMQYEAVMRSHEQEEAALRDSINLLDGTDTDYRTFRQRREEQSTRIVEPDLPLDEMSFADYKKARDAGK